MNVCPRALHQQVQAGLVHKAGRHLRATVFTGEVIYNVRKVCVGESVLSPSVMKRILMSGLVICFGTSILSCTDHRPRTVRRATEIRAISGLDELSIVTLNDKSRGCEAGELRKIADLQAEQWDASAKLVWVFPKAKVIHMKRVKQQGEKSFRCRVATWLFVYKDAAGATLLGVTVGVGGVIDVGKSALEGLEAWPPISAWGKEATDLPPRVEEFESGACDYELMSQGGSAVWYSRSSFPYLGGAVNDAWTGRELSEGYLKSVQRRQMPWGSVQQKLVMVDE
jgi:hypothetical protein